MVALPRRTVLRLAGAGAGWLAMAGCTGVDGSAAIPSPTAPPPPDPLLAELADERWLVALYTATAARHPALAVRLGVPQADHAQHAEALVRALDEAGSPVPTGSRPPSPPPRVPATAAAALAGLRAAERAAAAARSAAALAAPAHRAGLLASVAASESTHRLVLG